MLQLSELYSTRTAFDYIGQRSRISFGTWRNWIGYKYNYVQPIGLGQNPGGEGAHTLVFTRRMLDEADRRKWAGELADNPVTATADELAEIMTAEQVRGLVDMEESTFKEYYLDGRLPSAFVGRMRVFLRRDVEAWRETLRGPGRPEKENKS